MSDKKNTNTAAAKEDNYKYPPAPPPRINQVQAALQGNQCLQQVAMGGLMGATVGSMFGLVIGMTTCYMSKAPRTMYSKIAGKFALQMGGFFGGIMSIGGALRCEEDETEDVKSNNNNKNNINDDLNTYSFLNLYSNNNNNNSLKINHFNTTKYNKSSLNILTEDE
ncbi:reactive oxygen species modulator [Cavenderia fasciculata]|uniref:Reactive oxygen species modulator n=1 Tax=Cavenderia fasciculata TaxID=261658 RepID=F4Q9Z8_CACFS|nr:reactive oxygen species modulator [Cavenderia fasciculata]EGG15517.1 reactive oxygen species modulator [Cavenderia fasciculata]|eukprot:XP_004354259.1 reactive oxygen species modulator [Cavenderia fasciculata]